MNLTPGWPEIRGMIQQYVDALSSVARDLSSEEMKLRFVAAIWQGEFEDRRETAVTFPPYDDDFNGLAATRFPAFSRAQLRGVLFDADPNAKRNRKSVPPFAELAGWTFADYDKQREDFRTHYLDQLWIDVGAVDSWLRREAVRGWSAGRLSVVAGDAPAEVAAESSPTGKKPRRKRPQSARLRARRIINEVYPLNDWEGRYPAVVQAAVDAYRDTLAAPEKPWPSHSSFTRALSEMKAEREQERLNAKVR